MNLVVEKMQGYKVPEQVLLLCSRDGLEQDEKEYVEHIISTPDMDWGWLLGNALSHRVCGVVYQKIVNMKNVPWRVKFFLKAIYEDMLQRTKIHQEEIKVLGNALEEAGIRYAFVKGAVLNTLYYQPGERISGDTDMIVDMSDLEACCKVLDKLGYKQGKVKDDIFTPATKKQIIFARLNTYETVPFAKKMDSTYMPYHVIDVNFRLSNNDGIESALEIIKNTVMLKRDNDEIRTLNVEEFLIFLCIHHYREATMAFKIVDGEDFILYKYMDIHVFIKKNNINWEKVHEICEKINRKKDVYHTLYYTELLFPNTIKEYVFELLRVEDIDFLNQYCGRDNSEEVYTWKMTFHERVFSNARRLEAMENIKDENDRFDEIKEKLKMQS